MTRSMPSAGINATPAAAIAAAACDALESGQQHSTSEQPAVQPQRSAALTAVHGHAHAAAAGRNLGVTALLLQNTRSQTVQPSNPRHCCKRCSQCWAGSGGSSSCDGAPNPQKHARRDHRSCSRGGSGGSMASSPPAPSAPPPAPPQTSESCHRAHRGRRSGCAACGRREKKEVGRAGSSIGAEPLGSSGAATIQQRLSVHWELGSTQHTSVVAAHRMRLAPRAAAPRRQPYLRQRWDGRGQQRLIACVRVQRMYNWQQHRTSAQICC